ncbi:unnamed protein product (macronuclear) [Paramecium tetraurelia]|uniref:Uncharacterized protein n=1 Tax=Paramecium tetraurelia TaxID=5888 RepID=A0BWU2_PARTE|nr:uncharacterized protein GSPATT00032861001 [Paramecium tetraurelia]CAK63009.1 unnamed protein product [Paramecium tetraurelia]|eukprot:XP_001430407.1 hypothetical protein (macronuclear) [Paramecium tetraurelia strain d4-2]
MEGRQQTRKLYAKDEQQQKRLQTILTRIGSLKEERMKLILVLGGSSKLNKQMKILEFFEKEIQSQKQFCKWKTDV